MSFILRFLSTYAAFYALSSFTPIASTRIDRGNITHVVFGFQNELIPIYSREQVLNTMCVDDKTFSEYRNHLIQLGARFRHDPLILHQLRKNLKDFFSRRCYPRYETEEVALRDFTRQFHWIR